MQELERARLARRALLDSLRLANLLDRQGGALARQADITSAQWLTLGMLARVGEPGMTPTELCRQLCVSKQNMTGMVVRLQKKGLIDRQPDAKDRRSFRVFATRKGIETVLSLENEGADFFLRQVGDLDDRDLTSFAESVGTVLDRLRDNEKKAHSRAEA
jgi:MarR family transcriptional regulator, organic hydroperoxide resistance regulator